MKAGIFLLLIGFMTQFISAQSLVSIAPNSANDGQTLNITITGTGTHFTQGSTSTSISLGMGPGIHINSCNASNDLTVNVNATVAAYAYTGDYDVSVYNTTDGTLYLNDAFHVNGILIPSLVSVSPVTGNNSQTLDITITGNNTHFLSGSNTSVNFEFLSGSTTGLNYVTISDESHLTANMTIPPYTYTGTYDVGINNIIDGTLTLANSFTVNGIGYPSLASINPASANAGQTLDVTITGTNTHFLVGSGTTIDFEFDTGSSTVINSVTINSDVSMTANITISANTITGSYDVGVYNSIDHWHYLYNGFYINGVEPPHLESILPTSAYAGQTLDVTITGTNTHFLSGSGTNVDFEFDTGSSTVINSVTISSESIIIANITVPLTTITGYYDVGVYSDADGWKYLYNAFHIGATAVDIYEKDACKFSVLENPLRDRIRIKADISSPGNVKIYLTDGVGRSSGLIFDRILDLNETIDLDISNYNRPPGLYLLRVEYEGRLFSFKVVLL